MYLYSTFIFLYECITRKVKSCLSNYCIFHISYVTTITQTYKIISMKNYFWWTSCRSGWSGQRFPSTSHLMFSIAMRQGKKFLECHTHPLQWSAGMSSHAAFMHPTETSDLVVYDHILSTSILKEMVVIVLWAIYIYDDDEWWMMHLYNTFCVLLYT